MPNQWTFHPRINKKIFNPAYYDSNYIVTGGSGGNMANPYDITSQNPYERQSAYLWGRWHEGGTFGDYSWSCNNDLGRILEYINTQLNTHYVREFYEMWYDAPAWDYIDGNQDYHYFVNTDNIGRNAYPTKVGQIVTFRDENQPAQTAQATERGGVIEYFNTYIDYTISMLDVYGSYIPHQWPDPDPIVLIHITNNEWPNAPAGAFMPGRAIDNYFSTVNSWPIIMGKPIGWIPKSLLYAKHYFDLRKGNVIT